MKKKATTKELNVTHGKLKLKIIAFDQLKEGDVFGFTPGIVVLQLHINGNNKKFIHNKDMDRMREVTSFDKEKFVFKFEGYV